MGAAADDKDFARLKARLVQSGKLYEDPTFPANESSISGTEGYGSRSIVWRRPKEIHPNAKFIVAGATRYDLNQGDLSDCWFIAATACLATTHKQLLEWCVPPDQDFDRNYAGIFHFNFWQFGSWVEVVIDDRLPCREQRKEGGGKEITLVYGRNDLEPNEYWVPLFEKAYAKLNGCYENLNGGFSSDALVDFTGGISEYTNIVPMRRSPGNLFEMLSGMAQMSSLIGTHINGASPKKLRTGLYTGHAYSITKIIKLDGTPHRLLRLRNPWGKDEWNGAWCDGSKEWSTIPEKVKQELELIKREDGEFWMSFEDWLANFERLTMCHLYPDAVTREICETNGKRMWDQEVFQSEWIPGVNSGGSGGYRNDRSFWKNPQFPISVNASSIGADGKGHVIVSLMQKSKNRKDTLDIGIGLCELKQGVKLRGAGENYEQSETSLPKVENCMPLREICVHYELKPGHYVVIPCTQFGNTEGEFMLRVYRALKR